MRVSLMRVGSALLALGIPLAAGAQTRPSFLVEAEQLSPGSWTQEQLTEWLAQAEQYLEVTRRGEAVREHVYYAVLDWAQTMDGGKSPREDRQVIDAYFEEFPAGQLRDEFEWARVQNDHWLYEHDEDAGDAVRLAQAFERYLVTRPDTRMAEEIRLAMAWEYQIAFEILTNYPDKNPGYSGAHASEYHERARRLLEPIVDSPDPRLAAEAKYLLAKEYPYMGSPSRRQPQPNSPPDEPAPPEPRVLVPGPGGWVVAPAGSPESAAAARYTPSYDSALLVLLDVSGSMKESVIGGAKRDLAQRGLLRTLSGLPQGTAVSLRLLGEGPDPDDTCDATRQAVPFGPFDRDRWASALTQIRWDGATPLVYSMRAALRELAAVAAGRREMLIIGGGEETCGGDPVEVARAEAQGVRIHTISLGEQDSNQLAGIALATAGTYTRAFDDTSFEEAVAEALPQACWLRACQ